MNSKYYGLKESYTKTHYNELLKDKERILKAAREK